MDTFVGLDVSLKETSVCVLNQQGTCVFEGTVALEPKAIARLIRKRARDVVRVGLESGATSVWLTHMLLAEGLPVVCLDPLSRLGHCRCERRNGPTDSRP